MAGPSEARDLFFTNTNRTVDATPPFDALLGSAATTKVAKPTVIPLYKTPTSSGSGLPATGGLGAPVLAALVIGLAVSVRRRRTA